MEKCHPKMHETILENKFPVLYFSSLKCRYYYQSIIVCLCALILIQYTIYTVYTVNVYSVCIQQQYRVNIYSTVYTLYVYVTYSISIPWRDSYQLIIIILNNQLMCGKKRKHRCSSELILINAEHFFNKK